MHHSIRGARPAAALTLAVAATLVAPGVAGAATTSPTTTVIGTSSPAPSTSTTTAAPTTTAPTTTASTTTASTTTAPTTTSPPTTSTTSTTTTGSATTATGSSATTTAASAAARATADQLPFRTGVATRSARTARVAGSPAAQAAYAGGFMVRTLAANDDHYNYPSSTFPDGGNTIDAILGLDGAGVGLAEADAATDYLAAHVNDYIGYLPVGKTTGAETYAGPTAKLILGVVAQGGDPTDFAGQDLVARLQSLMTSAGRFSDASAYGDYSNTIGQALAVIALGRSTGSVPGAAGDYLQAQQCTDGGFRGDLAAAGGACSSDPDATAFAAQALVGLLGPADPATARALTYLSSRQGADGGIRNDDPDHPAANANTTGVAAQAFAAAGLTAPLARAQDFLASLQYDCGFPAALRGGIAFTRAEYAARRASGRSAKVLDSDLRATPQATLGLAGGSLLSVTAEGASASAPTLSCPPSGGGSTTTTATTPATTPPVSGTSTSSTTSAAAPGGSSTSAGPGTGAAAATPAGLAFTGADLGASALLGALLLLTGLIALRLARRKGAHA